MTLKQQAEQKIKEELKGKAVEAIRVRMIKIGEFKSRIKTMEKEIEAYNSGKGELLLEENSCSKANIVLKDFDMSSYLTAGILG